MAVALDDTELVDLTLAYIDHVTIVSEIVGAELRRIFEEMGSIDRADIATFAREAGPIANAGRAEAADLTSGYLSELTGQSLDVIDLSDVALAAEQPFLRTWHNLKEGQTYDDARAGGASQAEALGNDHTMQGAADRMANPGVKTRGYRRVVSPNACEWCQVVATQIYRSADSARFGHHDCKCHVVAVAGDKDPALAINKTRLRELKASGAIGRASAARERSRANA